MSPVQKDYKKLCAVFVTFGVPVEISSDGGPEFSAKVTKDFLKRWSIHHMHIIPCQTVGKNWQ